MQYYWHFLGFENQLKDTSMTGEAMESDGQGSTSMAIEYMEQPDAGLLEIQYYSSEEGTMEDTEQLEPESLEIQNNSSEEGMMEYMEQLEPELPETQNNSSEECKMED